MINRKTAMTVLVLAALALTALLLRQPAARAQSYDCAVRIEPGCAKLVVGSGGALEVQPGAAFTVTAPGSFGTWIQYTKQPTVTVAPGWAGTITPTGTFQPLDCAAAAGSGSIAGYATPGRLLTLVGSDDTKTITISDTATIRLGAATRLLGSGDTLTLLSDGAAWTELGFVNN